MGVESWSTTAADNDSAPPNGAPEGMAASAVNDVMRQIMADVRTQLQDGQWLNWGHTPTRTDDDTFTVATDLTATYHAGRRLKVTGSATGYCTIASSSYSAPNTTVNVTMDSGNLPATLSAVYVGILSATNDAMPEIADARLSSNIPLKNAANTFTAAQSIVTSGGAPQWNFSDGTISGWTGASGSAAYTGTQSAHPYQFYTGNTLRGTIAAAGNWTLNAPGSGVTLALSTISGEYSQTWTDGTISLGLYQNSGSGYFGVTSDHALILKARDADRVTVYDGVQIGSPTGGDKGAGTLNVEGVIYQDEVAVALSDALNASALTSGTVPDARFPATLPATSGANLTALNASNVSSGTLANARLPATIDVATDLQIASVSIFASGTFTATLTGCTTSPTGTATWYRAGNIVTLVLPAVTATSNSANCTFTGLPAGIQPATLAQQVCRVASFADNTLIADDVSASIAASSGTITFFKGAGPAGGFTSSGTKGVNAASVITYLLT